MRVIHIQSGCRPTTTNAFMFQASLVIRRSSSTQTTAGDTQNDVVYNIARPSAVLFPTQLRRQQIIMSHMSHDIHIQSGCRPSTRNAGCTSNAIHTRRTSLPPAAIWLSWLKRQFHMSNFERPSAKRDNHFAILCTEYVKVVITIRPRSVNFFFHTA